MMVRFCNYCGKKLEGTEYVGADVSFRVGLPYRETQRVDFCYSCVDSAFGSGFTDRLKEEHDRKQKEIVERRKLRLAGEAAKKVAESSGMLDVLADVLEDE